MSKSSFRLRSGVSAVAVAVVAAAFVPTSSVAAVTEYTVPGRVVAGAVLADGSYVFQRQNIGSALWRLSAAGKVHKYPTGKTIGFDCDVIVPLGGTMIGFGWYGKSAADRSSGWATSTVGGTFDFHPFDPAVLGAYHNICPNRVDRAGNPYTSAESRTATVILRLEPGGSAREFTFPTRHGFFPVSYAISPATDLPVVVTKGGVVMEAHADGHFTRSAALPAVVRSPFVSFIGKRLWFAGKSFVGWSAGGHAHVLRLPGGLVGKEPIARRDGSVWFAANPAGGGDARIGVVRRGRLSWVDLGGRLKGCNSLIQPAVDRERDAIWFGCFSPRSRVWRLAG